MARALLGVTGSVAAIRTSDLVTALSQAGHEVQVVATEPSLYFFDPTTLNVPVHRDADEWPASRYHRGDPVLHIVLRDWADLLILAPLDAQTLARLALGLSDNLLACVIRAWDYQKPLILAPAMNTRMWESPVTLRHLRTIFEDRAGHPWQADWSLETAAQRFAEYLPRIVLIPPQAKQLACGDFGIGAMAEVATIAEAVRAWNQLSPE
ncbi:MAG: phosphopantothenoylcysteine decarboxylase [Isosphaeraceae bacterium]|jgi:phosphopantothenoylcysteine decarboxylase|nr:MAG: phosphopantothenoylcysteine decarboxylase [Isosphaeraceae bacterium]